MIQEPSEPRRGDVETGLAELERYVAGHAPAAIAAPPAAAPVASRRVRALAAELAEARQMGELLTCGDPTITVPSRRERRAARRAAQAERRHRASQQPGVVAARDHRVRLLTTAGSMLGASAGLAWSAIGVQAAVANTLGLEAGSVAYLAAYGVEAMLSVSLLSALGAEAYAALRGRRVRSRTGEWWAFRTVEAVLLGLILALNVVPHWGSLGAMAVHALGPIAACVGVWVLPAIWSVLHALPLPGTPAAEGTPAEGVPAPGTAETSPTGAAGAGRYTEDAIADMAAQVRRAVGGSAVPGVARIRSVLGVGTPVAQRVRDHLRGQS